MSSYYTLNPADLRCWSIAKFVLGSYAEDDSWPIGGGAVDVGVVQVSRADNAGSLCTTVDPDESHLARTSYAGGAALLHCHVHGIF